MEEKQDNRKMGAKKKKYMEEMGVEMRGEEIEIQSTRRKAEQETGIGKDRKDCGIEI